MNYRFEIPHYSAASREMMTGQSFLLGGMNPFLSTRQLTVARASGRPVRDSDDLGLRFGQVNAQERRLGRIIARAFRGETK